MTIIGRIITVPAFPRERRILETEICEGKKIIGVWIFVGDWFPFGLEGWTDENH